MGVHEKSQEEIKNLEFIHEVNCVSLLRRYGP